MLSKNEKIDLVMRMLGLKHKLKVHDSMNPAETHEELSVTLLARWEIEDEIQAIETILNNDRSESVANKLKDLSQGNVKKRSTK